MRIEVGIFQINKTKLFASDISAIFTINLFLAEIPAKTVFLTKPHMYGHNSSQTNVAFTPDFDKHESAIYFESISSSPVRAQLRIQLNANALIDRIKVDAYGETKYELKT